jgi:hypothetical protein
MKPRHELVHVVAGALDDEVIVVAQKRPGLQAASLFIRF